MTTMPKAVNLSLTLSIGGKIEKKQWHRRRLAIDGVFECKTCNRQFPTFQALGGHRTSHKRSTFVPTATAKVAVHKCAVCGAGFAMGQALGGHMRRHKAAGEGKRKEEGVVELHVDQSSKACLLELFV